MTSYDRREQPQHNAQEWRGGNKSPALECRLRQCRLNIMFHVDVEDVFSISRSFVLD